MVLASVLAVLGIIASMVLPVPYVVISPGPLFNTLGEYSGTRVVSITGTQTYPTDGQLDMTTVSERGGPYGPLTLGEAVVAYFRASDAVVPKELLFPPGESSEQSKARSAADFDAAQSNAVAAALGALDIPVTERPLVVTVVTDSPADGALEPGDVILELAGQPAGSTDEAVAKVRATPPGTVLPVVVERDGARKDVRVTVGANPKDAAAGYLGVSLKSQFTGPFEVDFALEGVGGPSAGLIFALTIVDELTPESLTGGEVIAGTGTIDPDGKVGAIGGIGQKMAAAKDGGAELFLAPRDNCDVVRESTPAGLRVAAVSTLDEALAALAAHREGKPVPAC